MRRSGDDRLTPQLLEQASETVRRESAHCDDNTCTPRYFLRAFASNVLVAALVILVLLAIAWAVSVA